MSGRPKAPAPTDAETARELTRDLHTAMRDGKTVLRELNAAVVTWSEKGAAMRAAADAMIDGMHQQVTAEFAGIENAIEEARGQVLAAQARALGTETPADLIKVIVANLVDVLMPSLTELIEEQLPALVNEEFERMARSGKEKYGGKIRKASLIAGIAVRMPDDNGATGTVPGGTCP